MRDTVQCAEMGSSDLLRRLDNCFEALLANSSQLRVLVEGLCAHGARAVVFGGWVRDSLAPVLVHRSPTPRDIDLVVAGCGSAILRGLMPTDTELNSFGGFSWEGNPIGLDAWCIEDTYTLKVRRWPYDFVLLPRTTVFSICSIIFAPTRLWGAPALVEDGFFETLRTRTIDMQQGEIRLPEQQVGRVVRFAAAYDLALSPAVTRFVTSTLSTHGAIGRVADGIQSHCHPELLAATLERLRAVAPSQR